MEVMSSLLFCALAALSALAPQTLGKQVLRTSGNEIIFNNTVLIQQRQKNKHKLLLNLNGQPLVAKNNELLTVYTDFNCKKCLDCMTRAVKAQRSSNSKNINSIETHDTHSNDHRLAEAIKSHRDKRSTNKKNEKQTKHKKSKSSKQLVTVTKYTVHGEIKAVKVKESGLTTEDNVCEIFSVDKYYPCNATEANDMVMDLTKRKNKKGALAAPTIPVLTPKRMDVYRKRQIDNSQLPENIMPSFEEMY